MPFFAVHSPIQTDRVRWEYYRNKAQEQGIAESAFAIDRTLPVRQRQDNPVYAGLIETMDIAVGIVLQKLSELGLDDNTLLIFTSDNGGVSSGDNFSTCNLPLRGGKGRQWEGGIRVPFFVRTPECYKRGVACHTPVSGIDIYPTVIDYAGVKPVAGQVMDGVSFRPLIKGGRMAPRPLYWHYPHYGNQGGEPSSIVRDGNWKLIYYHEDGRYELYNLATDIGEQSDLSRKHPSTVKRLKTMLHRWLKETGAIMPQKDETYSEKDAEAFRESCQEILKRQEELRRDMLHASWTPNADWWGSEITD